MSKFNSNVKKVIQEIDDPSTLAYGPPPEYPWMREKPWTSLLYAFNTNCSVLIIPTHSINKKDPPIVIIKSSKDLSIVFDPEIHSTPFSEYDHLILWKDTVLTKLPKSFTLQNEDTIEIPVKLLNNKDIKFPKKQFGEAKKYLNWLGLIQEERKKKENRSNVDNALDAIIHIIRTTKNVKPHHLPVGSISIALGEQMTKKDDEKETSEYTQNNSEDSIYHNRSLNRIANDLKESVKYCSPHPIDDKEWVRVIRRTSPEKIKNMYWTFHSYCINRKTPPPLKITSK